MKTLHTFLSAFWLLLLMAGMCLASTETITYTYNDAGRLIDADYGDAKSIAYTYDANGNMLSRQVSLPGSSYNLTVNSGSGSGQYAAGTVVNIQANAPADGKMFDQWTGDVTHVANVNTANTTVTMPSANVAVTATYKDIPPTLYALTVTSGTGSGQYVAGTVVNIQANAPAAGKMFDKWTGDVASVADVNSASTTVTMPSANITVNATFSQKTYTVTATAGEGGSINPASRAVLHGQITTFTVTPNTDYRIATVSGCGGSLSGHTYITGAITGNCNVAASFSLQQAEYMIAVFAEPAEAGVVQGGGAYTANQPVTVRAAAHTGWVFQYWTEDGVVVSRKAGYTFSVTRDRTLVAHFKRPVALPGVMLLLME